jgi:hypothetical protein
MSSSSSTVKIPTTRTLRRPSRTSGGRSGLACSYSRPRGHGWLHNQFDAAREIARGYDVCVASTAGLVIAP